MKTTDEFIATADSLPIDIKIKLIDRLLKSLNTTSKEVDELWASEAEKRVEEIKSGKVEPLEGEAVFKEIRENLLK